MIGLRKKRGISMCASERERETEKGEGRREGREEKEEAGRGGERRGRGDWGGKERTRETLKGKRDPQLRSPPPEATKHFLPISEIL